MYKGAVCERPETDVVKSEIEKKLELFDDMCRLSGIIEIDGITENDKIKIINHSNKEAYEVDIETVIKTPIKDLMLALETGVHINVISVTRVVGYYSRINNWNKSKANIINGKIGGELGDRMKGNYWIGKRVNTGMQPKED